VKPQGAPTEVTFRRLRDGTEETMACLVFDPDEESRNQRAIVLALYCKPYHYDSNWANGNLLAFGLTPSSQKGIWVMRLRVNEQVPIGLLDDSWSVPLAQTDAREIAHAVHGQKGLPIYFTRVPPASFDPSDRKHVAMAVWVRDTRIALYRNEPVIDREASTLTLPGWFRCSLPDGWDVTSRDRQWERNVTLTAPGSLPSRSALGTIEFQRRAPDLHAKGLSAYQFCEHEIRASADHAGIGAYDTLTIQTDPSDPGRACGVGIWQGPDLSGTPIYSEYWLNVRGGRGLVAVYQGRYPTCMEREQPEARMILDSLEFLF